MLSDYDNMKMTLGGENTKSCERELIDTINGSIRHNYAKTFSHPSANSSQAKENRSFSTENQYHRPDRLLDSIENSNEIKMRFSQEKKFFVNMMHSTINRAIRSAISERVIPESVTLMVSLSSGQRDTESESSFNNRGTSEETTGLNPKLPRKNSRTVFGLRDTGDLNFYMYSANLRVPIWFSVSYERYSFEI